MELGLRFSRRCESVHNLDRRRISRRWKSKFHAARGPESLVKGDRHVQTININRRGDVKKPLATIALAVLRGMAARAAQTGDSVFGFVAVENRVELAVSNDPQEVTHIASESGVWLASGLVNFLSLATPTGIMFTAGNISVGSLSFNPTETASITAEQVARLGNIIRNTAMVPPLGRRGQWHERVSGRRLV